MKGNNADAASLIKTSSLQSAPLQLNGSGVNVGIWDTGHVYPHQEFSDRLTIMDSTVLDDQNHATHVAGTIGSSGQHDFLSKGMAAKVSLFSYDFNNDLKEIRDAVSNGIYLSNHSYNSLTGWEIKDGWTNLNNSDQFGKYKNKTRELDSIVYDTGLHVFWIAGNERDDGPDAGTNGPLKDGSFDTINSSGSAKNVITIGAVDDKGKMSNFSSWGPTGDGRIKPDLCANGVGLYSTLPENQYGYFSGTSMACPNACGTAALLHQLYQQTYSTNPKPETLKALLIHGADDVANPGPDYQYGWGIINAQHSADLIQNRAWITQTIASLESNPFVIDVPPNQEELKVTVVWTDLPASPASVKSLVNDLDLLLYSPSRQMHFPYIVDPRNSETVAMKGTNSTDNVEQAFVTNPEPGCGIWR